MMQVVCIATENSLMTEGRIVDRVFGYNIVFGTKWLCRGYKRWLRIQFLPTNIIRNKIKCVFVP